MYLAQLEGYDTFAGLTFARSPYINKEKFDQIFLEVNDSIIQSVEKYWDEVEEYSFETEGVRDIDFTDSRYYEGNYNFSPEIKNLYLHEHDKIFEFESVCEAVFELFDNLYGLKFEKDNSIPVPRENIQAYRLIDNGKDLGIIYFDFFIVKKKVLQLMF